MCQLNDYQKEVNESEVESSIIPSFVSQCLDASSKAPEYVLSADDDSVNYSVVQDAIMDKKKVGSLALKNFCLTSLRIPKDDWTCNALPLKT